MGLLEDSSTQDIDFSAVQIPETGQSQEPWTPVETVNDNEILLSVDIPFGEMNSEVSPPSTASQNIAWPWLHEDMFLQTNINLDWLEVPEMPTTVVHNLNALEAGNLSYPDQEVDCVGDISPAGRQLDDRMEGLNPYGVKSRMELIDELTQTAFECTIRTDKKSEIASKKHIHEFRGKLIDISARLELEFGFAKQTTDQCLPDGQQPYTDLFFQNYMDNFWMLWPLFPRYMSKPDRLGPLLYLGVVSIGAMYGGKVSSIFGTLLHNKLRELLTQSCLDHDLHEHELLHIGQTRSLTQAAALYFGQKRAFSYAQHIGAILVAQARRMDLFTQVPPISVVHDAASSRTMNDWLEHWIRRESRKRLAFAILRLEMYISALQATRPLLSAEEMDVELPCSRYLWHNNFGSNATYVSAIRQELSMSYQTILFSDLIRLTYDEEEKIPHLDLLSHELLMNATQEKVWAACSGKATLQRLVPHVDSFSKDSIADPVEVDESPDSAVHYATKKAGKSMEGLLATHSRKLLSTRLCIKKTVLMLRKCHNSQLTREIPSDISERSSLLSCLLIYHLGFLQLNAPLQLIQSICHMDGDTRLGQPELWAKLWTWRRSLNSREALSHATAIYELLNHEARRPSSDRAYVNFLTMIGLYHSATLVWVYANTCEIQQTVGDIGFESIELDNIYIQVKGNQSRALMEAFGLLFRRINPAWASRSSFCAAIKRLEGLVFPAIPQTLAIMG
ncbi:hypothetical protein H2198_006485 [Neophaeococcomyces mojaviensis]|uniref:Uncharacterized protein n=1 Tax=Neophaeococcomyces mojaviensis TaxID=3383035 RepID=A0ACC3A356_9EURO|nr:hypothetical protein H2198_006485 [Knufia sp. JES_112]